MARSFIRRPHYWRILGPLNRIGLQHPFLVVRSIHTDRPTDRHRNAAVRPERSRRIDRDRRAAFGLKRYHRSFDV